MARWRMGQGLHTQPATRKLRIRWTRLGGRLRGEVVDEVQEGVLPGSLDGALRRAAALQRRQPLQKQHRLLVAQAHCRLKIGFEPKSKESESRRQPLHEQHDLLVAQAHCRRVISMVQKQAPAGQQSR